MLQIDCAITRCPMGAAIQDLETIGDAAEIDDEHKQLVEHLYLRQYLRTRKWIPILVGLIEELAEVWICPDCQELVDRARDKPEG